MAPLPIILYLVSIFCLTLGQLVRPNLLGAFYFPLADIVNLGLGSYLLLRQKPPLALQIFFIIAFVSIIANQFGQPFFPLAWGYFLRLIALAIIISTSTPIKLPRSLSVHLLFLPFCFFGLIQYLFFPDLLPFSSLNWDPHQYRLVSSLFDPAFTGLIIGFYLIYLTRSPSSNRLLVLFVGLCLLLTYSRISIIGIILISLYRAFRQHQSQIFLTTLSLILLFLTLLPQYQGESTNLSRTNSLVAKINNTKSGLSMFSYRPLLGVGYNFLPQIRTDLSSSNHAISGYDVSLVTLLATLGIIGTLSFLFIIQSAFLTHSHSSDLLIFWLFHSFFSNSLFYPFAILAFFWLSTLSLPAKNRR